MKVSIFASTIITLLSAVSAAPTNFVDLFKVANRMDSSLIHARPSGAVREVSTPNWNSNDPLYSVASTNQLTPILPSSFRGDRAGLPPLTPKKPRVDELQSILTDMHINPSTPPRKLKFDDEMVPATPRKLQRLDDKSDIAASRTKFNFDKEFAQDMRNPTN